MPRVLVGRARTVSLQGLLAQPVLVEAVLASGLPNFTIVGLADAAVNEARERLRSGFHAIGQRWPNQRLTVNLSPADITKSGTAFDLGIAVAVFGALGFSAVDSDALVLGELGLDGSIRGVQGVLPALLAAQQNHITRAIVPAANYAEAQLVSGLEVTPVDHLAQVARLLGAPTADVPPLVLPENPVASGAAESIDMADVCGQEEAIWGLTVAAAGGHHALLVGPPGVGKSMLAQRLPGILPDLSAQAAVEVAAIRSVCGEAVTALPRRAPFSAPHHSATVAALVGGGSGIPRPGAITRAHRGILFCDEFPEFSTSVLQALRQPLETGWIELHRAKATVRYPARFQLIAAANPCRCGRLYDAPGSCTCTSRDRINYRAALGGPVRDRIDISLRLNRPSPAQLKSGGSVSSSQLREKITAARDRQLSRSANTGAVSNSELTGRWLRQNTKLSSRLNQQLEQRMVSGQLSMRAIDRILRLSWTVADLAGRAAPTDSDVMAAMMLRGQGEQ
ncbi:MAG: YifB family Mg chelatase-like AAA ATPase [Trueperella sp.]|nr:YifB family Mg chelatase-like AAA ATPase [Trueperella sp.]